MTKRRLGNRVGKNGHLGVGCSASVFDTERKKVLLIRRADNGKWDVPGGYMDPGESFGQVQKFQRLNTFPLKNFLPC